MEKQILSRLGDSINGSRLSGMGGVTIDRGVAGEGIYRLHGVVRAVFADPAHFVLAVR